MNNRKQTQDETDWEKVENTIKLSLFNVVH